MLEPTNPLLRRVTALGRGRPGILDLAGVAFIVVLGVGRALAGRDEGTAGALFAIAMATPLLWRRRHPLVVFVAVAAIALVQWTLDVRSFGDAALLIGLYTVAVTRTIRVTAAAALLLEVGVLLAAVRWAPDVVTGFVGLSAFVTAAAVLGTSIGQRRALLTSLTERAARLERERDQQGQLSAAAERSRIARELHDVVAHNLTVMIALADGASYAVYENPQRAQVAMTTASRSGRQALTEMRRLLGVLRDDTAEADLRRAPQPGLSELDDLIDQVRAADLPVTYEVGGRARTVPTQGLQLTVYRVVQEALTNTLKHAGPEATAHVTLSYSDEGLSVEVRDTGRAPGVPAINGGGLRGMRERAALYEGVLHAGPEPAGGWCVRLRLPIGAPSSPVSLT